MDLEIIQDRIFTINNINYILDSDLANFYGLTTSSFNQTIKRNLHRFDDDFVRQLTEQEYNILISKNFIEKTSGRGGRTNLPYAFTIEGTVLLCGILSSPIAIEKAKYVAKEFIRLKKLEHSIITNQIPQSTEYVTKEDFDFFANQMMQFVEEVADKLQIGSNTKKQIGFTFKKKIGEGE